ncbi:MAG: phosphatidylinositol alpha 1,6-mannosyltransferase [Bacillariaceae sp.]|jgi:phosphatidylinositol alpha 1,6-mannosyltransferase
MHMEDGGDGNSEQQYQRYRHLPNKHPNRTLIFLDNSIPIPFLHDPNNPEDSYHIGFSLSNDVRKQIDDFGPTIVHIAVPDVTCLHLIQYARTLQLPLMGTYHSNIPDYFSHYPGIGWLKYVVAAYVRHQYNFLQALYVPTPFIRRHLTVEDHYRFDKVTNLNVWGRGVDLERFHPSHRCEDFRARFGFTPDDVVVTWVGRLVPEKRTDIFAHVIRRLAEEGIPFKALVVGAGPNEAEMKSLPNTSFAGWISGDELAVAYASSDIFLFPSAVETFGNVTLEAAASGLPLVVDSGCSGHLVQHGLNGFVCNDGDLESYYNGTLCLVLDDLRRKSMSKEGRKFSLRFENRTVCRRMIDNYSSVTDEFYRVYNGNHDNRDREYEMKEGSFLGGSFVRPTSLMLVEYVFIILFRIAYRMSELISNAKGYIASFQRSTTTTAATTVTTVVESSSTLDSSNNEVKTTSKRELTPPPPTTRRNGVPSALNSISEVEEPIDDSISYDSHQEVHSLLSQSCHKQVMGDSDTGKPSLITMLTKTFDDDTDSTDSNFLSDDDNSSSSCCSYSSSNHRQRVDRLFWNSGLPWSHNLAILFIKCVRAQGRIESRIRKCRSYNISVPSSTNKIFDVSNIKQNRKRKGSEEITPDDYNGTKEDDILAMQLKESLLPLHYGFDYIESNSYIDSSTAEEFDGLNSRKTLK